jgi:hypothetical protein
MPIFLEKNFATRPAAGYTRVEGAASFSNFRGASLMNRSIAAFAFLAALAAALPLRADWLEDFSGGVTHQPWIFVDDGGTIPPNASIIDPSGGSLIIGGDSSLFPTLDTFVVGLVGVGDPAYAFADVRHRATVSAFDNLNFASQVALGNNDEFIIVRSSPTLQSYLLALDFNNGDVDLVRIDAGPVIQGLGPGSSSAVPAFDPTRSYVLEVIAQGPNLTGNVYDGATLVASVAAIDATYAAGWSGIGAAINDNDTLGGPGGPLRTFLAAQFDDVSSIPEPSTLGLGLVLATILAAVAARRRRTACNVRSAGN